MNVKINKCNLVGYIKKLIIYECFMNRQNIEQVMQNFSKILQPLTNIATTMSKIQVNPELQKTFKLAQQFRINPEIQELIKQTNTAIQNHEKTAPHIEKMLSEMEENENLSEAFNTLPYKQIFRLALNNFQVEDLTILKLINEDFFHKSLLSYFDEIEMNQSFKERKNIVKEALKLYELEYFAGCSCLLHSTLEGIITDYLLFKKIIIKTNKKGKTQYKVASTKESVIGLAKKIGLAKDINDNFLRLENYKFDSNKNKKFSDERNDVLHGSNINNFTSERCFITFIWITSILDSIRNEQLVNSLSKK